MYQIGRYLQKGVVNYKYGLSNKLTNPNTSGTQLCQTRPFFWKRKEKRVIEPVSGYEIVPIAIGDEERVLSLLRRTFFHDEPVIAALGLTKNTPKELEQFVIDSICERTSVMAVRCDNDKPLGVCINGTFRRGDPEEMDEFAQEVDNRNVRHLLKFWAHVSREAQIWDRYHVSHVCELRILATDPEMRGLGVARKLTERSIEIAKCMGYPLLRVDCTSRYSAKLCENLGMDLIYELKYQDYKDERGKQIIKPPAPHDKVRVYVHPL